MMPGFLHQHPLSKAWSGEEIFPRSHGVSAGGNEFGVLVSMILELQSIGRTFPRACRTDSGSFRITSCSPKAMDWEGDLP